jgi:hypothetical protein
VLNNLNEFRRKKVFPFFVVMAFNYILIFSLIGHKEDRFILPVYPFLIMLMGDFVLKQLKTNQKIMLKFLAVALAYELIITLAFYRYHDLRYLPFEELMKMDGNPH